MKTGNFIESEVFDKLEREKKLYSPLEVYEVQRTVSTNDKGIDGYIKIKFRDKVLSLLIEIKNRTAPQIVETGIDNLLQIISDNQNKDLIPTLIVPYLSDKIVDRLKSNNLCGLDLNGNYYIVTPDFVAVRLDKKNQYKESAYIKDIYSRNSSIVGRFLLREKKLFSSVNEIYNGIRNLGGTISLSTVSKVLKGLEEQLIISKDKNEIKLLQPDKLLNNLKENYIAPSVQRTIKLNLPENMSEAKRLLFDTIGSKWIWAGESCAAFYATTTPINSFTVFVRGKNNPGLLEPDISLRFYNYIIYFLPPVEEYVFFDSQDYKASKLQSYLELSQLDKREKEIARDIEKDILNDFK